MTTLESTAPDPLWVLILLRDYRAPSQPARDALRSNIRSLIGRLSSGESFRRASSFESPELVSIPSSLIDRLVPHISWSGVLTDLLDELLDASHGRNGQVQVIVAPPYCGLQAAVAAWAQAQGHALLAEPAGPDVLMHADAAPWDQLATAPTDLVVIPALERFYLRHHRDFALVRSLVDDLGQRPHRSLIVCDSWAWEMLGRVTPIHLLAPTPLTLAPFQAHRLEQWIQQTVEANFAQRVVLRRADTGKKAVTLAAESEDESPSDYLANLAAYVRGNPGVAAHVWRQSLAIAAADRDAETTPAAEAASAADLDATVWVTGLDKIILPALPGQLTPAALFILHALLLHSGLTTDALERSLSTAAMDLTRQLVRLDAAGLIEQCELRWRVTPTAYPAVRTRLQQEGFLTDAL